MLTEAGRNWRKRKKTPSKYIFFLKTEETAVVDVFPGVV